MTHHLQGLCKGRLNLLLLADIDDLGMDLAAVLFQLLCGIGVLGGIGAPDADIGAGLSQRIGHAEADAAIAAGDQRHLAIEIEAFVGHGGSLPQLFLPRHTGEDREGEGLTAGSRNLRSELERPLLMLSPSGPAGHLPRMTGEEG
jgi:hypothetical protein